jgi:hypothetical protein
MHPVALAIDTLQREYIVQMDDVEATVKNDPDDFNV